LTKRESTDDSPGWAAISMLESRVDEVVWDCGEDWLESAGDSLPAIIAALFVLAFQGFPETVAEGLSWRLRLVCWFCNSCKSEGTDADSVCFRALDMLVAVPLVAKDCGAMPSLEVAKAPAVSARVIEVAEGCGCEPDWLLG
jgi:hypothetical protein